jgi:hypothetical protein
MNLASISDLQRQMEHKKAYASQWFLPEPAAYISLFVLGECMGKSLDEVLEPVINEIRLSGLMDRWERKLAVPFAGLLKAS